MSTPPSWADAPLVATAAAVAAVALASGAAPPSVGSWPVVVLALGGALVAALSRRPLVLAMALVLAVASLGARSWAGLADPPTGARCEGVATVVEDPAPAAGGTRLVLSCHGRRLDVLLHGSLAATARPLLTGDRVDVAGRVRPLSASVRPWLQPLHIAARLDVTTLQRLDGGRPWWRAANGVRGLVVRGDRGLGPSRSALLEGVVLGDDRAEDPETEADFAAAGLGHLLAVSGQNLAFALAVASPLLRRLRAVPRAFASLACIAAFCVLVRFEPSVLRAGAMVAVALVGKAVGSPVSGLRLLAAAVIGCLLVDPLLVHRLGFTLSVAASLGLIVAAAPIGRRVPGPRWLAEAVGASLAAQLFTAPVLAQAGLTGGPSGPALLANVLAVPVAGVLTGWGLVAGPSAGLVPALAPALHLPTRLGLWWIASVAHTCARLPGVHPGPLLLVGLAGLGAAFLLARTEARRLAALVALAFAAFVAPSLAVGPGPDLTGVEVASDAALWRGGGATLVVLGPRADPARLLRGLDAHRASAPAVVVTASTGRGVLAAILALQARRHGLVVLGPATLDVAGVVVLEPPSSLTVGSIRIEVSGSHRAPVVSVAIDPAV